MKNINIFRIAIVAIVMYTMVSCDDFFDINNDPNNPTSVSSSLLLTSSEAAIAGAVGLGNGISRQTSVFMHQIVRRGEGDQYVTQGNDFSLSTSWQTFYDNAMPDLKAIIDRETEDGNLIYVGIAKLLQAYSFSVIVDIWGDVPYSQAAQFVDFRFPEYDDDQQIYTELLALIDEGVVDILDTEAANLLVPGADDLIYGGDTGLWVKFANTLKLKLLYQMQDFTMSGRNEQISALIANPDTLINDMSEDFEFWYGASGPTPENRHGLFVSEYTQANPGFYVSPWLYETMVGQNTRIFTNLTDPRVPYYWHKQLLPGEAPENPFEYLTDDGFLTIHFGSIHPNQASGQQSSQSVFGLYPCGGFYDNDSGSKVNANSGDGVAPERMLPYFKVLYMRAELALAGITTEDHRQLTMDAIQASFDEVNEMVATTSLTNVPAIDQDDIDLYILSVLNLYDNGSDERKLEIILTQKWIASLGNTVDAYTDYRREGYPVLFDPNNYNGNYVGSNPQNFSGLTTAGRAFPLSLPWQQRDLDINPNSPSQKDPTTYTIFWDVN